MEHIILHSIQAALLFFIISSPIVYNFVNQFIMVAVKGCPTTKGLIVHSIVYGLLYYFLVKLNSPTETFAFRGIVDPIALKQKEDAIRTKEGVILGGIDNTTVNYTN
jgi:hypothetical protein